jgi:hypothetical protein
MDLLDEWLAEQQARTEAPEEKREVYQKPRCAVCAGAKPVKSEKHIDHKYGITQETQLFKYPGVINTEILHPIIEDEPVLHAIIGGATVVAQLEKLTDNESEIVVDLHYCFDQERLIFQARGGMPTTDGERERLDFLLGYAFRLRETRGRKVGQIDTTPRRRRRTTSADDHKAKILAAISELRKEPIYRKDVARVIGIREATLRDWIKEIGEEWDALISEALPRLE